MARSDEELAAIAARTEAWLDHVDPDELTPVAPQILTLRQAVDARANSQAEVDAAVRAARNAGFSWGRIAEVLGISRQAAHERYAAKTAI